MKLLVAMLMIPVSVVLNGWALSILWGWFMEGLFDAPPLTIAAAAGLSLVVVYLTHPKPPKDEDDDFAQRITYTFLKPFVVLLVGFVITLFM